MSSIRCAGESLSCIEYMFVQLGKLTFLVFLFNISNSLCLDRKENLLPVDHDNGIAYPSDELTSIKAFKSYMECLTNQSVKSSFDCGKWTGCATDLWTDMSQVFWGLSYISSESQMDSHSIKLFFNPLLPFKIQHTCKAWRTSRVNWLWISWR